MVPFVWTDTCLMDDFVFCCVLFLNIILYEFPRNRIILALIFYKGKYSNALKYVKRCLAPLVIEEMQIKATVEHKCKPPGMITWKKMVIPSVGKQVVLLLGE